MNAFKKKDPATRSKFDLTDEQSAEVARLAERILEVSEDKPQRQLSVVLLMMTRVRALGLLGDQKKKGFVDQLRGMHAFVGTLQALGEKYPEETQGLNSKKMADDMEKARKLAEQQGWNAPAPSPGAER